MKIWIYEHKEVSRPRTIGTINPATDDDLINAGYKVFDMGDVPRKYWIIDLEAETVVEMTAEQKAQKDADDAAAQQAAEEAAAAAEALRLVTPLVMDQMVEMPKLILQSETTKKGIGIVPTDDGELITWVEHASPRVTPEKRDALIAAAKLKRDTIIATGKAGVSGQLQNRIENIERYLGMEAITLRREGEGNEDERGRAY